MRLPATAMALVTLTALAFTAWASGCTSLSGDCELNLNCDSPTTAGATSGGAGPMCNGYFFISPPCDACVQSACCKELGECGRDKDCLSYCMLGPYPSGPECSVAPASTLIDALETCMSAQCASACAPEDECNPVTNNGCAAGKGCDLVYPGSFVCLSYYTPTPLCGACDNGPGPYCGGGMRCYTNPAGMSACARYCCNDMDCGTGARCELDPMLAFGAPLGVMGDMGGVCVSAMPEALADCNAPAVSPSNGACFGGFSPM